MRLSLAALFVSGVAAAKNPAFKYGHATYTYGPLLCEPDNVCAVVPSCNRAGFAKDIEDFNTATETTNDDFSTVLSYGGDIEFWAGKNHSDGCARTPFASEDPSVCNVSVYFDPNNLKAAEAYSQVQGVKSITALLDSRMDGWEQIKTYDNNDHCEFGNFYPDLRNLSNVSMQRLADDAAKLYCASPLIDGVQVDLEPYHDPYTESLNHFVSLLSANLVDEDNKFGCRDETHPTGRQTSYFCFAHDIYQVNGNITPSPFNDVLGPNGYYVFSAYDLDPKPEDGGFMYNTPDEFKQRFAAEIPWFRKVLGDDYKFTIAVPLGASCHEYEYYKPNSSTCGPACEPQASGHTMDEYVQAAFDLLLDPQTTKDTNGLFCMSEELDSQFLGISWWSWSYQMTYPPMKWFDNEFLPAAPPPAALDVVRTNLPKLQDGTTCTKAQRIAMGLEAPKHDQLKQMHMMK
eukprot:INCI4865.1.p1 GENE.INCI4865.1~~INCI4865.1.p1  ORF type:complete len:459 (+),score=75.32 INCI4865.1:97-1473(+)